MLNYSAQLTEENTEYVDMISRAYGISSSDVINAALDEKRKNDAGTLKKIKEFMGKLWKPGQEATPIPVPDEDPGVIFVPTEKKKRFRMQKKFSLGVAREIEETEREGKMSRE